MHPHTPRPLLSQAFPLLLCMHQQMSEGAEEEVLLREHLYDVSASIHQLKRWPLVKRGYIDLTMYLCFFVLFVAIVLMQTEVTRGLVLPLLLLRARSLSPARHLRHAHSAPRYQVSYALREGIVMQSGQVDAIKSQNDWWKYLLGSSGQAAYAVPPPPPPPRCYENILLKCSVEMFCDHAKLCQYRLANRARIQDAWLTSAAPPPPSN